MNNETIIKVAIGAGGLAVGGAAGYYVAVKRLEQKYAAVTEAEIESVREMYKRRNKVAEYETVEQAAAKLVQDETPPTAPIENNAQYEAVRKEYEQVLEEQGYKPEPITRNVFDTPEPDPSELVDPDKPYEITTAIFMEDDMPDKVTLTYYSTDDVLVDEREQPITDVDELIGEDHLNLLDEKNNVVYVRNETINTDFEILLQIGAYSVLVLGNDEEHLEPRKRRGSRQRDDG